MSVAIEAVVPKPPPLRIDLFRPAFVLLALVLAVLVVLPLSWLLYYSLIDKNGAFTLANFAALVNDVTLRKPFLVAIGMALGVGALSCAIATPLAWLVSRTDLPGRRVVRALVTASFVTPPFLGAIAWEILAAPNSGLVNVAYRALTGGQPYDAPLVNIYTLQGLIFAIACYTFPYVFTLVANGLDRVPSDLEDASAILGARPATTLRRVTIPLVLPAMLAGSLIAILQALTMFGSPAILALPAGFHVVTTKIWSLFQYPPKPGLAAAASLPLLAITVLLLQGKSWILGRKGYTVLGGKSGEPRITRLGRYKALAIAFVARRAVAHRDPAVPGIAEDFADPQRFGAADLGHADAAQLPFRVLRVFGHAAGDVEHVPARYSRRPPWAPASRCWPATWCRAAPSAARRCSASWRPRRWRSPASCWAWACS